MITLTRWRLRTEADGIHAFGRADHLNTVLETTPIAAYDPTTETIITETGSVYHLDMHESGCQVTRRHALSALVRALSNFG